MLTRLRPTKILFYLRFMAHRGYSHAQVLDGVRITPRHLADRDGDGFTHRVRAFLHQNLARHPGVDEVAGHLCCTGRTLNRRLTREGTHFSELAATTRLEAIRILLATTRLDSETLAGRVGFSDARSLRRFFPRSTAPSR